MHGTCRTSSAPTTTSSSCRSRTESTSRTCAGTWTSRSPTSPRSGSARSPSSRHATSRSRSPGQGADELFAGYRKHRAAAISGAFARATSASALASPACVPDRGNTAVETLGARDPVERLIAASATSRGRRSGTCSSPARSPAVSGTASAILRERLGDVRCGRTRLRALPRRPTRPRRRHAPLFRPRLDGPFARGAGALPRPSARRAVRDDPVRDTSSTASGGASTC